MSVINNVLELSQLKADRVNTNGDYHVTLAEPIVVNEGDQVNLRLAALDTQRVAADTIIIPEDLPVSITFSTYDVDYDKTDKVVFDRSGPWDGDGNGNPSFDYFATYTDQHTLYEFERAFVSIPGFTPPTYKAGETDTTRTSGSMILPRYFQNVGNDGLLLTIAYIDASGNPGTFQISGGNARQWVPGSSNVVNPQTSNNTDNYWVAGISNPNGVAQPAVSPNLGQVLECTEDQVGTNGAATPFGPPNPPNQRTVFRAGTLKLIKAEGNWCGSNGTCIGQIFVSEDFQGNVITRQGQTSVYPGSTRPGRKQEPGYDIPQPVALSDFAVNLNLVESGGNVVATPIGTASLGLDIKQNIVTIPAGSYDPNSLAITMTQLLNDSNTQVSGDPLASFQPKVPNKNQQYIPINPFLQRTDDVTVNATFHTRITDDITDNITFTNQNTYEYFDPAVGGGSRAPYFIGASQFALEYGSAGDVFSLEYAHMPLFNPDEDSQREMVGVYWTGNTGADSLEYYQVNQSSGIAIHDLQPESFWQDQLGIRDRLIVQLYSDSNGIQFYTRSDLLSKITFGYSSLNQFLLTAQTGQGGTQGAHTKGITPRKMTPIPPSVSAGKPDVVYIDVTGETRAIIARTITAPIAGGFYLVEINGLGYRRGSFIDSNKVNPKISGIISANYLQGNILTGFGDSAVPYTHIGNPYVISEASVRILDANGNPPLDLGPNNVIFVDVLSQDAIILQQQALAKQKAMQQTLNATKQTQRPDERT
jgi:hypothetical protein